MDPRLRDYYERELRHLAEMCGEFARAFPKIAGRLSLEGFIKEFQCPDPYVERLLEGFAYMAARVQLKVDAEYPRFTEALLNMVYPDYLTPVPSMGVVQIHPDLTQGSLNEGIAVARGTALRGLLGKEEQTACEYRTAHAVTLWPVRLETAAYLPSAAALGALGIPSADRAKAGLQLRLKATAGAAFDALALNDLVLYLRGNDQVAMRLYEQLMANATAVLCRNGGGSAEPWLVLRQAQVRPIGFSEEEALLPHGPRSFEGYRLLKEYFAFPDRFLFASIAGINAGLRRCPSDTCELMVLFDASAAFLREAIEASRLALFCTPAVNLFSRRADRIQLTDQTNDYHLVADRARPMDYEVYSVTSVHGFGAGTEPEVEFQPFYACSEAARHKGEGAFYTVHRAPRVLSSRQRQQGPRSSYVGTEVFVGLVDASEAPYRSSVRQLGVGVLCTNRDLPLQMPVGIGRTDLTWEAAAPILTIRFLAGPTEPRPATAFKETAWKLVSHLALNYLSLADESPAEGARALRELLSLYAAFGDRTVAAQVEGFRSVAAKPVHRRLPIPGPVAFGRGLQIALELDEGAFTGTGVYLLGAVLEQFFARYVSINAFTECVLSTPTRGEIKRWPPRIGQRHLL